MDKKVRILITGAAGFIGSYLLGYLNKLGFEQIIIADDFSDEDKWFNFDDKKVIEKVEREYLFDWLERGNHIDFVFHLGARTDTTEFDYAVHEKLNVEYSKKIWEYCLSKNVPLVYASSAATYGAGELGYKDDHSVVDQLKPLNPYGVSKNEFDKWLLGESRQLQASSYRLQAASQEPEAGSMQLEASSLQLVSTPSWAGLKFFNVYGPNEYHKERMASMVFHGYNQIQKAGKIRLFRSHRPDFKDGEQLRDFIYVEDVAKVCVWIMVQMMEGKWTEAMNGLYNLGTGKARSFNDLANATFIASGKQPDIEYIDMPKDIRDKYQYFTEADMSKLIAAGYPDDFYTLEEGVEDYVKNYLSKKAYY